MRVLGIDYGMRRIGLAVSDPTGTIASPLETIKRRTGKRPPLTRLADVARQHKVERIVLGLPLDLRGEETAWCTEIREVGEQLSSRLDVPVDFVDERYTSVRAERAVRAVGLRRSQREEKGRVDAAAAVLILQAWLDRTGAALILGICPFSAMLSPKFSVEAMAQWGAKAAEWDELTEEVLLAKARQLIGGTVSLGAPQGSLPGDWDASEIESGLQGLKKE